MPGIDDVRRLIGLDNGLATVATLRRDGTVLATVVNGGVVDHPLTKEPVVAFVGRPGTRKVEHLRARPAVTLSWRAGWAWTTVEGRAELIGPDDPAEGVDDLVLGELLREIYRAAGGGEHEDWTEYDRVVAAERRVAVLVAPARIYTNP
ncbi:MAG: pyridoxamine 5'-phosphate oxidase family protein [Acidimicrobiia bacterium]